MAAATGMAVCLGGPGSCRRRGSAVSGLDAGAVDAVCGGVGRACPAGACRTADPPPPYAAKSTAAIAPPIMIAATTIRAVTPVRKLISSSQTYTAVRIAVGRWPLAR
jgi:hypothetical protein